MSYPSNKLDLIAALVDDGVKQFSLADWRLFKPSTGPASRVVEPFAMGIEGISD